MNSVIYGENADDWFSYGISHFDFNNDGYEDLGFSIQTAALEQATSLNPGDREKVADLMFPEKEYGN